MSYERPVMWKHERDVSDGCQVHILLWWRRDAVYFVSDIRHGIGAVIDRLSHFLVDAASVQRNFQSVDIRVDLAELQLNGPSDYLSYPSNRGGEPRSDWSVSGNNEKWFISTNFLFKQYAANLYFIVITYFYVN